LKSVYGYAISFVFALVVYALLFSRQFESNFSFDKLDKTEKQALLASGAMVFCTGFLVSMAYSGFC
jgi:hypothetical protein